MKRTTIFVPEALERDLQLYARREGKADGRRGPRSACRVYGREVSGRGAAVLCGGVRQRLHRHGRTARRDSVQRRSHRTDRKARGQAPLAECPFWSTLACSTPWPIAAMPGTRACAGICAPIAETLLAPVTILPEVAYLLRDRIGAACRARVRPFDCEGRAGRRIPPPGRLVASGTTDGSLWRSRLRRYDGRCDRRAPESVVNRDNRPPPLCCRPPGASRTIRPGALTLPE